MIALLWVSGSAQLSSPRYSGGSKLRSGRLIVLITGGRSEAVMMLAFTTGGESVLLAFAADRDSKSSCIKEQIH